jgi:hypothetical protein
MTDMKEKQIDVTKMEFLVKLNENIVIQRFFNVKNFNDDSKNSMEVHEYLKETCQMLENQLWVKTHDYMNENMELIISDPTIMNTSKTDGPEWFNVSVKVGEQTICQRGFDAKPYPPKARYTLDMRPVVKNVLNDLTDIFSAKNFSKNYMNYTLG